MDIIKQSASVWGMCPTDIYHASLWIERAGRVCYNSAMSNPPAPDAFIKGIMKNDPPHSSVMEHSSVVVYTSDLTKVEELCLKYYSRWITTCFHDMGFVLFGNARAFMEVLKVKSLPDMYQELGKDDLYLLPVSEYTRDMMRITVELNTDRNVLAEITRHRNDVGFSVQSQRYVDLASEVVYIYPSWWENETPLCREQKAFIKACEENELEYQNLRKTLPPQHARVVFNGQVRTIIVMTAYLPQWDWIFRLRRAAGAYPQMRLIIDDVYRQFAELGFVDKE